MSLLYDLRRVRKTKQFKERALPVPMSKQITAALSDVEHSEFCLNALDRNMSPGSLARSLIMAFNAQVRINGKQEK